ncbi:GOLD domain [Trypanosoma melophagium]|uniref:GOLD domain n=1 Tax=Trypanosoma melophagium TaxID=715481 RepID=UPI00351A8284|nr:GOLD domain [Trypanosoma melophagium]
MFRRPHSPSLFLLLLLLLLLPYTLQHNKGDAVVLGASAFRFTARPGRKCFTAELPEAGRYVLHYRLPRSLAPLVSVAASTRDGRPLLEHEVARPNAHDVISVDAQSDRTIAVCFRVADKAPLAAAAMHITLDVLDAEEAELTRQKRQSYSTSSPIGVGVGKASGAMQQMQYIFNTVMQIRYAYVRLLGVDEDMQYSFDEMNAVAWVYVYVFAAVAVIIALVGYFRLRLYFLRRKYI